MIILTYNIVKCIKSYTFIYWIDRTLEILNNGEYLIFRSIFSFFVVNEIFFIYFIVHKNWLLERYLGFNVNLCYFLMSRWKICDCISKRLRKNKLHSVSMKCISQLYIWTLGLTHRRNIVWDFVISSTNNFKQRIGKQQQHTSMHLVYISEIIFIFKLLTLVT